MLSKLKSGSLIYLVNRDGEVMSKGIINNPHYVTALHSYVEIIWKGGGRGFYNRMDPDFWNTRIVLICEPTNEVQS
jgi:hypothetical protein